jgi:hypothetical protein
MKKILLVLGLCSSLAFSEVYYKNKDNKYVDRDAQSDQIRVSGYITNVNEWRDYSIITIKQREGDTIKAKVGNNDGFHENDIVNGTCVNYKYGQYERCSLYRR